MFFYLVFMDSNPKPFWEILNTGGSHSCHGCLVGKDNKLKRLYSYPAVMLHDVVLEMVCYDWYSTC